jgi:hypothetical protein
MNGASNHAIAHARAMIKHARAMMSMACLPVFCPSAYSFLLAFPIYARNGMGKKTSHLVRKK